MAGVVNCGGGECANPGGGAWELSVWPQESRGRSRILDRILLPWLARLAPGGLRGGSPRISPARKNLGRSDNSCSSQWHDRHQ